MRSLNVCEDHGDLVRVIYAEGYDRRSDCPMCILTKEKEDLESKVEALTEERDDFKNKLDEAQQDLKDS